MSPQRSTLIAGSRRSPHPRRPVEGAKAWVMRNSLVEAALRRLDELHKFPDVRGAVQLLSNLFQGLRRIELRAQQQAKCAFDRIEALAVEAAAFEADGVHAVAM